MVLALSATLNTMNLYDTDEFRATDDWPYAIAAGCLVYRKNKDSTIDVLLLTRDYDSDYYSAGHKEQTSYHLPKGHVKFNESVESAALRETAEEIGAEVELKGYLGALHLTFNHPKHQNTTDKEIHYFAAEWVKDIQKTDNEHDGRDWIPLESAEKLLGLPNPKQEDTIVQRFKKYLELTNAS
jgi:8-oxo-dGTP pyrophosphatase MutT (NUDIX family)